MSAQCASANASCDTPGPPGSWRSAKSRKTIEANGPQAWMGSNPSPPQRLALAQSLTLDGTTPPVRRVWLPTPGSTEQRPLGIPTMADSARHTLVKSALEPAWEARFAPHSEGLRPGRSCHDAIAAIFTAIGQKATDVLDADIETCFDRIAHDTLLATRSPSPYLRRQLRAWLQAGVLDHGTLLPTDTGTLQGSPLSPLLANVALHGLETAIIQAVPPRRRQHGPPPMSWCTLTTW